ncbi:hypothetical protein JOD43_002827 [Pullulanibacillus pueri]|uniref:SEC-C motif-containing protein n=1 Tax=Pullulanibacillus pueri TaxID=1437324 RepID=A0A8J2ZW08_9BACL|nr:hypothetical protein [Pullulanibacillus pueri]MBM7682648.1 hypothetical protein [Pullulanibacillus pueri]GGH82640.1 hypothetical protein GCM10007096_22330 [Pullulanibacillus pueri]
MSKKLNLCPCGSGIPEKLCCGSPKQINIMLKTFNSPQERQELLNDIDLSREFNMRYRGLFEYYGKDLIAYKRIYRNDKRVNDFLDDFSYYMTDHLEEDCPPSWEHCYPPFWEELIFAYIPLVTKISPQKNETKQFLTQLKSFIHWLDTRVGTSWASVVNRYVSEAASPLQQCEDLFNQLFLSQFPNFYQDDWNYDQDIENLAQQIQTQENTLDSIYKITEVSGNIVLLTELDTQRCYPVLGLPCQSLSQGMLIDCILGRKNEELFWSCDFTQCVFPERAEKYIMFV